MQILLVRDNIAKKATLYAKEFYTSKGFDIFHLFYFMSGQKKIS